MAQQDIDIGVANAGDGDTLFAAFTKVQNNFDDLYSDDTGDIRGVLGTAPIAANVASNTATVSLNDLGVTSGKLAANSVITDKITDLNVTTAKLANDSVTYAKLGTEFTTSAVVSALAIDFATAQVFTKTISADSTFTFTNVGIGMVKDLILAGNAVPTFPAGSKIVAGTYSATADNFIQIVVAGTGNYWLSISQAQ